MNLKKVCSQTGWIAHDLDFQPPFPHDHCTDSMCNCKYDIDCIQKSIPGEISHELTCKTRHLRDMKSPLIPDNQPRIGFTVVIGNWQNKPAMPLVVNQLWYSISCGEKFKGTAMHGITVNCDPMGDTLALGSNCRCFRMFQVLEEMMTIY